MIESSAAESQFAVVALLVLITAVYAAVLRRRRPGRRRTGLAEVVLLLLTLAWIFVVREAAFARFAVQSHGLAFTLAAQRCFEEYWQPVSRWGYRDPEIDDAALAATYRLFVLGDSVASGQGIDFVGDRIPDRLREKVGSGWSVLTLARPGWGTRAEKDALLAAPLPPHYVVLIWSVNDIMDAAEHHGVVYAPDLAPRPRWLAAIVERSHFVNFVHWRTRAVLGDGFGERYYEFLERSFGDPTILTDHVAEILDLADTARGMGAGFLAVLLPELSLVEQSARDSADVARHLVSAGVPVLDLGPYLRERDPRSLRVNAVATHPHASVHAEVAELIFARLQGAGTFR